jgi:hypothetical protein
MLRHFGGARRADKAPPSAILRNLYRRFLNWFLRAGSMTLHPLQAPSPARPQVS